MRCDDYCCNYGCNQGRHCPARQACQLPELESDNAKGKLREALIGALWAAALVGACLLVAAVVVPHP